LIGHLLLNDDLSRSDARPLRSNNPDPLSEITIRWYRRKILSQWGLLESYALVSDAVFRPGVAAFVATASPPGLQLRRGPCGLLSI
jgi:hypothetical protein